MVWLISKIYNFSKFFSRMGEYVPLKQGDRVMLTSERVESYFERDSRAFIANLQLTGLIAGVGYRVEDAGEPHEDDRSPEGMTQSISIMVGNRLLDFNSGLFERKSF